MGFSFTVGSLVGGGGETGRRQYGSRAVKSGQTAEVGSNLGIGVNAQGKMVDRAWEMQDRWAYRVMSPLTVTLIAWLLWLPFSC